MKRPRGRPVRYPWDKWLESKKRVWLKQGRDYDCQSHSMAQQIRNAAGKRNKTVSVCIDGDTIIFSSQPNSRRKG